MLSVPVKTYLILMLSTTSYFPVTRYIYTPRDNFTAILWYSNTRLFVGVLDLNAVHSQWRVWRISRSLMRKILCKWEGGTAFPSCQCLFPVSYILTAEWRVESQWDTLKSISSKQSCISHQWHNRSTPRFYWSIHLALYAFSFSVRA